jgi:hypothetical protein
MMATPIPLTMIPAFQAFCAASIAAAAGVGEILAVSTSETKIIVLLGDAVGSWEIPAVNPAAMFVLPATVSVLIAFIKAV